MGTLAKYKSDKYGASSFEDKLLENGWKQLGAGAYAAVYGHKKHDWVFKIGMTDDINNVWLDYCHRLYVRNPLLPKVRELLCCSSTGVSIAVMERLKDFDPDKSPKLEQQYDRYSSILWEVADNRDVSDARSYCSSRNEEQIVRVIDEICKKYGDVSSDIKEANMMVRSKYLVLTDPICGENENINFQHVGRRIQKLIDIV